MNHKVVSEIAKTVAPLVQEAVLKAREENEAAVDTLEKKYSKDLLGVERRFNALAQQYTERQHEADELREQQNTVIAALLDKVKVLEQRAPVPGPMGLPGERGLNGLNGRDGEDGKDGEPGAPGIDGIDGKDGADGSDGERGLPGEKGADGKDGVNGRDGVDGITGKDGAVGPQGEPGINGRDGADGLNGKDGADGINGKDGAAGDPGLDGKPGRDGRDGTQGISGRDGKDGAAGRDGLGFDDLRIDYDGQRMLTFALIKGEERKTFTFTLPIPLEAGTYVDTKTYEKGDVVSFGGSMWIAQRQTTAKPEESKDWRLCVKRGRDGKEGKNGAPGAPGKDGSWLSKP